MKQDYLVEIRGLRTTFQTEEGLVPAVNGVDLAIRRGETLAVVGESGCGKSVTALSILRLIPSPPGRIEAGEIVFEGRDLLRLSDEEMRRIRGNEIAMIFQEPMTSLNPVFTVGDQIAEVFMFHRGMSRRDALEQAVEMLRHVGIPAPERRVREYPHQMSGGMRQRVMIAMALACHPKLLIADEPTTALDVTIQAQILDLMRRLKEELGMAILLITHDLGVVAEMAERVVVMYAGRVVEEGDVYSVFRNPVHPYTEGLLRSIPRLDEDRERLPAIEGTVPSPGHLPGGCPFHPRCPYATDTCREVEPRLEPLGEGRYAACHLAAERLTGEGVV
ncbi:ABC transporter ATP-binding protein [Thermaerobacter sp. PB12/4term]|uniref:ABC transporter ATP-binding protein n=1 Tax=Thermaerobacter sp. PB12/4term TaxID=2293838 RepID=UPI000E32BFB5|nr:ABC transporter ATP-binding protein [Thermaerobacter sp. PB12/4term]QIA27619.1 ABC transporter ATP-binding protein [Thermaerobacter sp. PB12/4term]